MSTAETENPSGRSLKGLELSEQYYHELVEPAVRKTCPEALPHLAAGLVGEGSDCFGFDDGISKDHDWGPRVCLWLQDAAYERFFHVLSSTLASLPDTFRGERFALRTPEAAGRQGVLRTGDFYSSFTGSPEGPRSFRDWLSLPESHLAACTNGKVFYDGPGRFSMIRHHILNGCPEDVRRKRLAARIALMAQSLPEQRGTGGRVSRSVGIPAARPRRGLLFEPSLDALLQMGAPGRPGAAPAA